MRRRPLELQLQKSYAPKIPLSWRGDMPANVATIRRVALPGSSLFQLFKENTSADTGKSPERTEVNPSA